MHLAKQYPDDPNRYPYIRPWKLPNKDSKTLATRLERYTKEIETRWISRLLSTEPAKLYSQWQGNNTRAIPQRPTKAATVKPYQARSQVYAMQRRPFLIFLNVCYKTINNHSFREIDFVLLHFFLHFLDFVFCAFIFWLPTSLLNIAGLFFLVQCYIFK